MLAGKAYDSNDLRQRIADMKAEVVIPSKRNRKVAIPHDVDVYKHRNRIELCFNRLNTSVASQRATIAAQSTSGFIHLAAAMIWLR